MQSQTYLKLGGVVSLTVMLGLLALDGVDNELVLALAAGVVAIVAPDVLEQLEWGPF